MPLEESSGPVGLGLNHGLPLPPDADQPAWGHTLARLSISAATPYQKSLNGSASPKPTKDGRDPQLLDSDLYSLLSKGKAPILAGFLDIATLQTSKKCIFISPLEYLLD